MQSSSLKPSALRFAAPFVLLERLMTTSNDTSIDRQQARSGGAPGLGDILVIAGDDQRARLVRSGTSSTLEIVWEGYAASEDVRALGQAPDITRNSADATPPFHEGPTQFANDVAERVRGFVSERPSLRLLVIAPPSFASELKAALGGMWPSLPGQVIRRDETGLEDERLLAFIETTLKGHPGWFSVAS